MEKFVRKDDGLEIDDDDIFLGLLKNKAELWLIALELDEFYGKFEKTRFV